MDQYQFSSARIDEHIVKVGVDIRPVFEPKLDHKKLYDIGQELQDTYPQLFESLVQSPSEFRVMKKFLFTNNNAEVEVATLSTTPRGVVFTFPKMLAAIGEEIEIENIDDIVVDCLGKIKKVFPHKKIVRVGLVNEYIFDTVDHDSCKLICDRFVRLSSVPSEIQFRINNPTDDHNRIIEMKALQKIGPVPEIPGHSQNVGYGIRVVVDFNNRNIDDHLEKMNIYTIIHDGQRYNEKELYDFLNRTS